MSSTPGRRGRTPLIAAVVVAIGAILALVWVVVGRSGETDEEPTSAGTETVATPSPEPSATPTAAAPASMIGLTAAGDLVELDPADGSTVRTIASDTAWAGPLSLTPDRSAVYLAQGVNAPNTPEIVRVLLADGAAEVVAQGRTPSLSPDGTRLAYVGRHPTNPDEEYRALHILDLATDQVTYVPDNSCGACARRIDQPAWAPDGSRLYVAAGFMDSAIPSMDLLVVEPGTTADLDTAAVFQAIAGASQPGNPGFLADGRLAVVAVVDFGTGGPSSYQGAIGTYDVTTAAAVDLWQFPQLHTVTPEGEPNPLTTDAAVAPAGTAMAIVTEQWIGADPIGILYLWEGGDQLTKLTEGITAVAW